MFPVARVKAVAKADPDIGRVQTAAYDATASAVEKFVAGLLRAAAERSTGAVGVAEVLKAIKEEPKYEFLEERLQELMKRSTAGRGRKRKRPTDPEAGGEEEATSSDKPRAARKKRSGENKGTVEDEAAPKDEQQATQEAAASSLGADLVDPPDDEFDL